MLMRDIAIIIPAYKGRFLEKTLESIAMQTCRDFTLYIGDDSSRDDIYGIVSQFETRMDIVYHRFASNLGGTDLVAHWERCIALSSETWIYLFSDDDIMPQDTVSRIKTAIETYPDSRFFRFRLGIIDGDDREVRCNPPFSGEISSGTEMMTDYFMGRNASAACEKVFHRSLFRKEFFVHFPLAWCADVAIWYKMADSSGGVVNIDGEPVLWRNAEESNISSSKGMDDRKARALVMFLEWLDRNYAYIRDMKFVHALYLFVKTNIRVSFVNNYTNERLNEIVRAFARFSRIRAMLLYVKFHRFS